MKFTKMQNGLNDFIIIDFDDVVNYDISKLARILCSRKSSIGADGLLLLEQNEYGDYKMVIYNADGTFDMMCGNGLCCSAKYFTGKFEIEQDFVIHTSSGPRKIKMSNEGYLVQIGWPKLIESISDITLIRMIKNFCSIEWEVGVVDVGIIHLVIILPKLIQGETHKVEQLFCELMEQKYNINVEVVEVLSENTVRMKVWERGVGKTESCGTGACAAVYFSKKRGLINSDEVTVLTNGGNLDIYANSDCEGYQLRDASTVVFEGVLRNFDCCLSPTTVNLLK